MLEAKTHLSRLVAELEDEETDEIIIARHGRPVARMKAVEAAGVSPLPRIGAARGAFTVPDDIDTPYPNVPELFSGNVAVPEAPGPDSISTGTLPPETVNQ